MYIGQLYDEYESLHTEFKEFTLSMDSIISVCHDNVRRYNNGYMDSMLFSIIMQNISLHIYKYIPKYISTFINTKTNGERIFNIGVDDNRIITGIPIYHFHENKELIYQHIYDDIIRQSPFIKVYKDDQLIDTAQFIQNNISIDIIPITNSTSSELLHKIKKFNGVQSTFKRNIRTFIHYQQSYKKWVHKMRLYGTKLSTILHNRQIRCEFIDYVYQKWNDKIRNHGVTVIDYKNRKITIDPCEYDHILKKFKDDKRIDLKKIKPIKPQVTNRLPSDYYRLMRLISNMNGFMNNLHVTYILIRIKMVEPETSLSSYYVDNSTMYCKARMIRMVNGKSSPENVNL